MVEICEECNQCVPDNGKCLSCGKQLPAREATKIIQSMDWKLCFYEGNE